MDNCTRKISDSIYKHRKKQASAISRRDTPELCKKFALERTEGVGNAGRSVHPQPRV
jgi:hypothetical protein